MSFVRGLVRICFWLSVPCALLSVSAFVMDQFDRKLDWVIGADSRLYVGQGHICWFSYNGGYAPGLYIRDADYELGIGGSPWGKKFLGIKYGGDLFDVGYVEMSIGRPLAASLLILILSAVAGLLLKPRRTKAGKCRKCGYDLTGNVSGRCPECGQVVEHT